MDLVLAPDRPRGRQVHHWHRLEQQGQQASHHLLALDWPGGRQVLQ